MEMSDRVRKKTARMMRKQEILNFFRRRISGRSDEAVDDAMPDEVEEPTPPKPCVPNINPC